MLLKRYLFCCWQRPEVLVSKKSHVKHCVFCCRKYFHCAFLVLCSPSNLQIFSTFWLSNWASYYLLRKNNLLPDPIFLADTRLLIRATAGLVMAPYNLIYALFLALPCRAYRAFYCANKTHLKTRYIKFITQYESFSDKWMFVRGLVLYGLLPQMPSLLMLLCTTPPQVSILSWLFSSVVVSATLVVKTFFNELFFRHTTTLLKNKNLPKISFF